MAGMRALDGPSGTAANAGSPAVVRVRTGTVTPTTLEDAASDMVRGMVRTG